MKKQETVIVLLSTYNGEEFLEEQIQSILYQEDVRVKIIARDDGSKDRTWDILKKYESNDFIVIKGDNVGFKDSFMRLIKEVETGKGFVAFADQDDIWHKDKLKTALTKLNKYDNVAALYSSAQRLVDKDLNYLGVSKEIPKNELEYAIIKNYAVGCTVVFNNKLLVELQKFKSEYEYPHDWLANVVCLAIGGVSVYDEEPHISYRQHRNNQIGAKKGFIDKWINRIKKYLTSKHNRELLCKDILNIYMSELSERNYVFLEKIANYKNNKFPLIMDRKICREKILYKVAFIIMVLTEKL